MLKLLAKSTVFSVALAVVPNLSLDGSRANSAAKATGTDGKTTDRFAPGFARNDVPRGHNQSLRGNSPTDDAKPLDAEERTASDTPDAKKPSEAPRDTEGGMVGVRRFELPTSTSRT